MNQRVSNSAATVTTTSGRILDKRDDSVRRVEWYVINLSATTVTIAMGDIAAEANVGIRLTQNQSYIQSSDAASECYQGEVQAIASGTSTIAVVERYEV